MRSKSCLYGVHVRQGSYVIKTVTLIVGRERDCIMYAGTYNKPEETQQHMSYNLHSTTLTSVHAER